MLSLAKRYTKSSAQPPGRLNNNSRIAIRMFVNVRLFRNNDWLSAIHVHVWQTRPPRSHLEKPTETKRRSLRSSCVHTHQRSNPSRRPLKDRKNHVIANAWLPNHSARSIATTFSQRIQPHGLRIVFLKWESKVNGKFGDADHLMSGLLGTHQFLRISLIHESPNSSCYN